MEQIRQILQQLALHLELNIAMCDKIDDHENRMVKVESHCDALKTRVDVLYRMFSEANYVASAKAYEARRGALRSKDVESKNTPENK